MSFNSNVKLAIIVYVYNISYAFVKNIHPSYKLRRTTQIITGARPLPPSIILGDTGEGGIPNIIKLPISILYINIFKMNRIIGICRICF